MILPITILRPGNPADLTSMNAVALIDTGATASGIDVQLARDLGLSPIGKRPVQSAHGVENVDYYLFRIAVRPDGCGEADFPYIFADAMGFRLIGGVHFNALIGMDILRQCDLSMDRSRRCTLTLP